MTKTQTKPKIKTPEKTSLVNSLKEMERKCKTCFILTPLRCATNCEIWKAKNEFRNLYEKMKDPNYMVKLLNSLKNKRRLKVLEIISKEGASTSQIQQELKKLGYNHSQQTIQDEYISPLIKVGLAKKDGNKYYATLFGRKINKLTRNFHELGEILPAHSECYEELTLTILLNGPKTYEDLKQLIPAKSVARVLSRLQTATLIEMPKEKNYVFYFKTRRDPEKEKFSPTERRVYEKIPLEGISASKLAEKTKISLRRTYKYLKILKKKKLVFTRKILRSYSLTDKGFQTAVMLDEIRSLAMEALATAAVVVKDEEIQRLFMPDTPPRRGRKKKRENLTLLTVVPYPKQS